MPSATATQQPTATTVNEPQQLKTERQEESLPDQSQQDAASDPASQQAQAYNPETGEINWDCPCLGPMTQPPCGEKFKAAFSCFVYSKEEPKGLDCIEQFREMQLCFREYPEIYGDDAQDDDEDEDSEDDSEDDEEEDDDDDSVASSSDSESDSDSDSE
ncbi:hypothetical protein BDR26DRAFT_855423 [Obelidium mucronatum]|nr:hypothetical protein BDR26DRAFT_855423 [Obelidium mucronatum]